MIQNYLKTVFSINFLKRRLPILTWLPNYNAGIFIQDLIAGLTVGLTSIPQGIAYAIIAGLPPEYGLYASLTAGITYAIFGSCKELSIGPTAILSALTAKYVSDFSPDFAVLAAFLSGILILAMGFLQLGFLIEFISTPVISGFTTAAALQIAASQLKSLCGTSGPSGTYFMESIYHFVANISTVKFLDTVFGCGMILILLSLKRFGLNCNRSGDGYIKSLRWFISLGRNVIVVVLGMAFAYTLKLFYDKEYLTLIGEINGGLPKLQAPPFQTVVGNETYTFINMIEVLGPKSIVLPFVAVLEVIAIAKTFSGTTQVNATQEMIALGLCNIIGSFTSSMPITAAFTRSTLNHVSGVQTPAGGIATVLLILLTLSGLTSTFQFIPKAALAALLITAVFSMIDITIYSKLWRNSKKELFIILLTMSISLLKGLEYGIVAGILSQAIILMYRESRPDVSIITVKNLTEDHVILKLPSYLPYCSAEYIRQIISREIVKRSNFLIVVDGSDLKVIDFTVASNLATLVKGSELKQSRILFLNFNKDIVKTFKDLNSDTEDICVSSTNSMFPFESSNKY